MFLVITIIVLTVGAKKEGVEVDRLVLKGVEFHVGRSERGRRYCGSSSTSLQHLQDSESSLNVAVAVIMPLLKIHIYK